MALRIEYPDLQVGGRPVVVEQLTVDRAVRAAGAINRLIVAAYDTAYSGPGGPLPANSFAAQYGTYQAVGRRQEAVARLYERGGGYLAVWDPVYLGELATVLKYLPGGAAEPRFTGHAGYAEALTHPDSWGERLAASSMHAWLGHTGLSPDMPFMSDVIQGSHVGPWLESMGCQREEPSGELELPSGSLPCYYYVSKPGVTIGGMVAQLEQNTPALRQAQVTQID